MLLYVGKAVLTALVDLELTVPEPIEAPTPQGDAILVPGPVIKRPLHDDDAGGAILNAGIMYSR